LQKFGRPNEKTPAKWNTEYKDFNRTDDGTSAPLALTTSTAEVLAAPAIPPTGEDSEEGKSKKRKHDEDESPEDKAERKRKKKEEKEKKKAEKSAKKEKRKSKGGDADSDSD
jgi:H/ACA ribonucleoprotein complex subunit 4